jgi:hypothetical protein
MTSFTPDALKTVLQTLQQAQVELVVIGGQAINLWAMQYYQTSPEWEALLPFGSLDLDFYGSRIEVAQCGEVLQGQVTLARDFDPSPNAGVVMVDVQGDRLRIDILASVYGLADAEVTSTALLFQGTGILDGLELRVLHPLLCLEGKLKCLRSLDQSVRQDEKHVRLAILILQAFLTQQLQNQPIRPVLNLIERIVDNTWTDAGLNAWYRYDIEIETAIPLNRIQTLEDEQWQTFCSLRWSQICERLAKRRSQYQRLMERPTSH